MTDLDQIESLESFRLRARTWLAANMPRKRLDVVVTPGDDDDDWLRARELQAMLYAGGFAGICFPPEYGGLGLSPAYQAAFTEESVPYEMPVVLNVPTLAICAPVLLEYGTEEQKQQHIPAVLRGEEVLVQFLSEPSGGSDLAGVITRAERDGDNWIINGAKTWSTSAYAADFALCLTRTNSDVPKHRGLTMFLMPTNAPGLTMRRIRMVNGATEFCEEFFDDVVVPASEVIGEVDHGWSVASRQLFFERTAVSEGSPYTSGVGGTGGSVPQSDPVELARLTGRASDPVVRERLGAWKATQIAHEQLIRRITQGIELGLIPEASVSCMRLLSAEADWVTDDTALLAVGDAGIADAEPAIGVRGRAGINYLMRQATSLGGGSTEMSRNLISERLLGMPRDTDDRNSPFKDIKKGPR
jgi:alkylation response protein AidB-like acyl-CoA dehydrogenase